MVLLPQGIVGRHYFPSIRKEGSSVLYAKGDKKGSIDAPFLSIKRIQLLAGWRQDTSGSFQSVMNLPRQEKLLETYSLIVRNIFFLFQTCFGNVTACFRCQ